MKACWIIIVAALAGCSVKHRSEDFACERNADCSNGRSCVDGACVYSGTGNGGIDAGEVPGDGQACPSQCTSCDGGTHTCTIDCALNGAVCDQRLTCPAGWNCDVRCNRPGSCSNVSCGQATSCKIACNGAASCTSVTCGSGPCNVACNGQQSCIDVACNESCACDVSCSANAFCDATCTQDACVIFERGCTTTPRACNTCP